ncbi:MAG: hypothetical protein IPO81_22180 [Kouleothrix sp.]|nr:hypothetical protein [Kouleothrix sp.]
MTDSQQAVAALFAGGDPDVRAAYERLLEALRAIGPFAEQPKQTSIHLARATGFAGVHPRKRSLTLNLRTDSPIASPRLARVERVSKNRYHNEIKLNHPDQVDAELVGWLRAAYALGE